jgi:hypothetical protein
VKPLTCLFSSETAGLSISSEAADPVFFPVRQLTGLFSSETAVLSVFQ